VPFHIIFPFVFLTEFGDKSEEAMKVSNFSKF